MTFTDSTSTPSPWQVELPSASAWQRIVQKKPLLDHLERGVRQLDPPEGPAQFWRTWHAIEHRLAEIFDGPLRPPLGTDHDRAVESLVRAL